MEETKFEILLRKAAQETTRRHSLGALIGGALLLNSRGEIEATKKAKRRKKHKRQQRRQAQAALKRIRVTVNNPSKHQWVSFTSISPWVALTWKCWDIEQKRVWPGRDESFITSSGLSDGFIGIANSPYFIEFWNPVLRMPSVSAAVNGLSVETSVGRTPCPQRGTRAINNRSIPEGMTFKFKIYDKEFTVYRGFDTQYKEFTLTLPTNL